MKCEKKNCENCHKSSEILSAIVKIKDGRKAEALFVWLNCFEIPADEISTSADRSSFSLVSISSVQWLCGEVGCQTDSALAHSAMHKMCSQYHKVYLLIESLSLDPFFLSDVCSFSRDALNKICKMCMNVCEFVCVCVCVCVCVVFSCLPLPAETWRRPPFTSSTLTLALNPSHILLPSNPRSHFLPLQRIHCLHNQRDFLREVFSLSRSPPPSPLSLPFSPILSWPPPLSLSLYFPQSDSFLWVYFYLFLSLSLSLSVLLSPFVPYMQSVFCWWTLWLNVDKSSSSAGEELRVGRSTEEDIQYLFFLSFFLISIPLFSSCEGSSSHLTVPPRSPVRLAVSSYVLSEWMHTSVCGSKCVGERDFLFFFLFFFTGKTLFTC